MKSLRRLIYYAVAFVVMATAPVVSAQSIQGTGIKATVINVVTSTNTISTDISSLNAEVGGEVRIFSITRDDVETDDVAVYNAADVVASTDFEVYARSVVKNDENVTRIVSSKEEVSVWYKESGKFLGFIPVTVSTKVSVKADGSVAIDRPWYTVLTMTNDETVIKSDLEATAGTIARAEGSAELSSNIQARLVNALRSTMKAHYDASASTETSVDVKY